MAVITALTEEMIMDRLRRGSVTGCGGDPANFVPADREGSYRRAAVLMLLVNHGMGWDLLFTRRTETVQDHKGQVSFPGGSYEAGDGNLQETALRETYEEIGLDRSRIRILGELDPMLTRTSFLVTPIIAAAHGELEFSLSPEEVGRVFTIPLSWLAQPGHCFERAYYRPDLGGSEMLVFFEKFDGEQLWGITARLVVNLLRVLHLMPEE